MQKAGPFKPYFMLIWLAAALIIMRGIVSGCARGLLSLCRL
jgi:hypothetical protein